MKFSILSRYETYADLADAIVKGSVGTTIFTDLPPMLRGYLLMVMGDARLKEPDARIDFGHLARTTVMRSYYDCMSMVEQMNDMSYPQSKYDSSERAGDFGLGVRMWMMRRSGELVATLGMRPLVPYRSPHDGLIHLTDAPKPPKKRKRKPVSTVPSGEPQGLGIGKSSIGYATPQGWVNYGNEHLMDFANMPVFPVKHRDEPEGKPDHINDLNMWRKDGI